MAVNVPTPDQLPDITEDLGLHLTYDDVQSFTELLRPFIDSYNIVDT